MKSSIYCMSHTSTEMRGMCISWKKDILFGYTKTLKIRTAISKQSCTTQKIWHPETPCSRSRATKNRKIIVGCAWHAYAELIRTKLKIEWRKFPIRIWWMRIKCRNWCHRSFLSRCSLKLSGRNKINKGSMSTWVNYIAPRVLYSDTWQKRIGTWASSTRF